MAIKNSSPGLNLIEKMNPPSDWPGSSWTKNTWTGLNFDKFFMTITSSANNNVMLKGVRVIRL